MFAKMQKIFSKPIILLLEIDFVKKKIKEKTFFFLFFFCVK